MLVRIGSPDVGRYPLAWEIMGDILHDIDEVDAYIDDIAAAHSSWEEHLFEDPETRDRSATPPRHQLYCQPKERVGRQGDQFSSAIGSSRQPGSIKIWKIALSHQRGRSGESQQANRSRKRRDHRDRKAGMRARSVTDESARVALATKIRTYYTYCTSNIGSHMATDSHFRS